MPSQLPWMVGLQADTAGAEERDRLARVLTRSIGDQSNWILLSTCHRVEAYGLDTAPPLESGIRVESGEKAVRHLMRVAAGLESAIVGENEVLHQIRKALACARSSRVVDSRLGRMFETSISAGRLARADHVAAGGNLAQRAVTWLRQRTALAGRQVLIVGAGRMGSALAHAATLAGADVTIASRNVARARRLAPVYGGAAVDLTGGAELATRSVAIAVALAGKWHEFQPGDVVLPPIADISAPPAVDASIRARLNGSFLGVDDLYVRAHASPGAYTEKAEKIVDLKTGEFSAWLERSAPRPRKQRA